MVGYGPFLCDMEYEDKQRKCMSNAVPNIVQAPVVPYALSQKTPQKEPEARNPQAH